MIIVWTPLAEERAAAMVESMRAQNPGVAWRWLQAMLARVRGLSERSSDGEGLREVDFSPCRIIYRIEHDRMVVLTLQVRGTDSGSASRLARSPIN